MVEHPAEYPWSNYRANAQGEPTTLVTLHLLYTLYTQPTPL
jgi:putative transposase